MFNELSLGCWSSGHKICPCIKFRLPQCFSLSVELGRAAKNSKKGKRVIRRWRLDRFGDDEVKLRYQNGLRAEVHGFSESIKRKVEGGMKGHDLVN